MQNQKTKGNIAAQKFLKQEKKEKTGKIVEKRLDLDFSGLTNDGSGRYFNFDDIPGFRD